MKEATREGIPVTWDQLHTNADIENAGMKVVLSRIKG